MSEGRRLRELRLARGWRLRDVAEVLGVTEATISRVERGLQGPSPALLEAWHRVLTSERRTHPSPKSQRRRPRGIVPLLADLYLADVKAGLESIDAGWQEPKELGLTVQDLETLGIEVEMDARGRVRVNPTLPMESLRLAGQILRYRATLEVEEQALIRAVDEYLPPLWRAMSVDETRGAVLLAGLSSMVRAAVPLLDAQWVLLSDEPDCLIEGAGGVGGLILESVGISVPQLCTEILEQAGLSELGVSVGDGPSVLRAVKLAQSLGTVDMARRLGKDAVTAVGAAWATARRLDTRNVAVVTESGFRRLSEIFWEIVGLSRPEVQAAWRQIAEIEPTIEEEAIGLLLWHWPEVL